MVKDKPIPTNVAIVIIQKNLDAKEDSPELLFEIASKFYESAEEIISAPRCENATVPKVRDNRIM